MPLVAGAEALAASASATAFTSATRRPQPRPNTAQVRSRFRKRNRSSQIAVTTALGSLAFTARMVTGPSTPSTFTPTTRCNTFFERPMPEFTP